MTANEHEIAPPRRVLGKSCPAWLVYVLAGLIIIGLGGGLWAALAPESLARIQGRWLNRPLNIENLTLVVDRQTVELPPNGTMEIHPGQRFSIAGLKTNRWRNYDLRLHCKDFNISAVIGGAAASPRELLAGESFERPRELRIEARDQNQVAAVFTILTRFTVLDFSARGDAADSPAAKIENYQKALDLDPASEPIRNKLIAALLEAGRKDRAAEILEAELARGGPREEILDQLLTFYQDLNLGPQQAETLGRLIKLAESRGRPSDGFRVRLARYYKNSGQPAQAAEIYEKLAEEAPAERSAEYLGELVALYHDNRDSEREIETLKRLAAAAPPDQASSLWIKIVDLYKDSGDDEGRLASWRALADSLPEGDSKVNALKMTGHLLYGSQKYDEARAAYLSALAMAPQDANILMNLARLGDLAGDRAAYRDYLARAVELEKDDLDLRLELARALAEDKQTDKAKAQYREIVNRSPEDLSARLALMELMEKTGDKKGLIEQYGRLAELRPEDKVVFYNLGALLFGNNEMTKAIKAFQKAIELDPKDLEAREYLVAAYQRQGRSKKEMLAEALALYQLAPAKTVYRTLLFNTYENDKDWANFAKVAGEVTGREPDDPAGWEKLAQAQTALNKNQVTEEAAGNLRRAAEKTKDKKAKVQAWLKAARAYSALKKDGQALEAYETVLKLEPENKTALKAVSDLKRKDQKNS